MSVEKKRMTLKEWRAQGKALFGEQVEDWKFVCPSCKRVTSIKEWRQAGASEGEIAFSCIGRHLEGSLDFLGHEEGDDNSRGCNYTGGGLFRINPVIVEVDKPDGTKGEEAVFEFYRGENS